MAKVYQDKILLGDKLIGEIDEQGKVYSIEGHKSVYVGWIDYEQRDVYRKDEVLIGWAEEDGKILAYNEAEDEEEEIGYINEDGELFFYDKNEEDVYFGKLKEWEAYAEGAAALLFFTEC